MSVEQLITGHLDIWTAADTEKKSGRGRSSGSAGSVYGVKKLRELILELAVRGKLVPQDESDEPASELLKRIATEKAKLIAEGKIKKDKPLSEITDDEKPFELPVGWKWVFLPDVSEYKVGKTPSTKSSVYWTTSGDGFNWVSIADLNHDGSVFETTKQITDKAVSEVFRYDPAPAGTILMSFKLTLGKISTLEVPAFHNEAIISIYPNQSIFKDYLFKVLPARAMAGNSKSAIKGNTLNSESIAALMIPLPPIYEQHRIVAKVDELMALCDQLENQHNNAAEAHEKLVTHLLGTLTRSQNAEDFNTNWQRISEHFDTLFTTEASIDALKQTLLQLAVMGKLVPQDPNDEPASELLKRIQAEKAKLIAEGKIKKDKPLAEITEEEKPFDLPVGWEWVRFGDISSIKSELVRPEDFQNVRQIAPDCIEKGTGRLTDVRTVKESGIRGPNSRFYKGQIVYSKIRPSLSKAVLVDFDGLCSADMYPIDVFINSQFMLKQILSECFLEQVRIAENRIKMPKLNQESLTAFILPLPPLTEQLQIVSKVNEIMTFCDQLKTQLISANQLQKKLADVLVEESI